MITPPFLSKNKTIGIISTARKINKKELDPAILFFKKHNFNIVLGKNIYKSKNQFAGNDNERLTDLQEMFDDEKINVIICARGGYGSIRIINKINFKKFQKNHKWIIGFSDITVLHNYLNFNNTKSIHGPMPINFNKNSKKSLNKLISILNGEKIKYKLKSNKNNIHGKVTGMLIGGNLSIIYSMLSDKYNLKTKNKILFIEDIDEYLYHIDRMMISLKRAGKLQSIKGLIVGKMKNINDNKINFGKNYKEIIKEHVENYNYPVCFDFPSGHIKNNNPLILGNKVTLNINNQTTLEFI